MPENLELGTPIYEANARDRDSGKSGVVTYRLSNVPSITPTNQENPTTVSSTTNLFNIDAKTGYLTLLRHLDYESQQRHTLIITATDSGEPPLSTNLTVLVEVQDVNDNAPQFQQKEYSIKVLESMPINSQVNNIIYIEKKHFIIILKHYIIAIIFN